MCRYQVILLSGYDTYTYVALRPRGPKSPFQMAKFKRPHVLFSICFYCSLPVLHVLVTTDSSVPDNTSPTTPEGMSHALHSIIIIIICFGWFDDLMIFFLIMHWPGFEPRISHTKVFDANHYTMEFLLFSCTLWTCMIIELNNKFVELCDIQFHIMSPVHFD